MTNRSVSEADRKLRRARTELEAALRAGLARQAEDILSADPALAADKEATLELVYTEFVLREELGQKPAFDEYHARFPGLRPDLEELFDVHEALRRDECLGPGPGPPRPARPTGPPRLIGDFEVLDEIGRGGMGVVYRAVQSGLRRVVALKVILSGAHAGKKERDRFQREVHSAARLDHPNIVRVYEVGEHDGHPFCAMEYVGGGSLADLMTGQPWPARAAAETVSLLARAAHHAHERGVVHRDLKPANILIARDEAAPTAAKGLQAALAEGPIRAKIADFGLAKCISGLEPGPTLTGDILGTPAYMAPEQAAGAVRQLGATTDVWALGVILYELLTGRIPFAGGSAAETLILVRREDPVAPRTVCPRLPRDLETICLKCLEKAPERRYASASKLADDLDRWLRGETIQARPDGTAGRALKWVRRHPSTALWLGLLTLVTATGLAGVLTYALRAEFRRREADSARETAQAARDSADAALYYQQVGRAYLEWQACNRRGAESLLASAARHETGWEWDHVNGLCHDEGLTLGNPGGEPVARVAYSRDGRTIVTATGVWDGEKPGEVGLWDAESGRLLRAIPTGKAPICGLALSPDGAVIATASVAFRSKRPPGVFLWDARTGAELGALPGLDGDVHSVAFSPDGRLIATGGPRGTVRLWDARSRSEIGRLGQHGTSGVFGLAFSADSGRLVSGGWDRYVRVWDVKTRKEIVHMTGIGDIRGVAFSPDGRHVAAAAFRSLVRVWDAATGATLATHDRHENPAVAIAYSPDGLYLASADNSGIINVREALDPVGDGHTIRAHAGIYGLAFSPDGTRLAAAGLDGTVRVRDPWRPQGHRVLNPGTAPPASRLAYRSDGLRLASAGDISYNNLQSVRDIRIWDVATGALRAPLIGHKGGVTSLAYNAKGDLLASGSLDGTARLWDADDDRPLATLSGHEGPVLDVAFDPIGERLASVGADGTLRLWHPRTFESIRKVDVGSGPLRRVAFSRDGTQLATAGADGRIRVWEAEALRPRMTQTVHDAPITCLAFSPDGLRIASGGVSHRVILWDLTSGRLTRLGPDHAREVSDLAFSPDGRRLVTASRDWSVRLWDLRTGAEAFSLRARRGEALSVAFRPDGRQIAAGLREGARVYLWDGGNPSDGRGTHAFGDAESLSREKAPIALGSRHWSAARYHFNRLIGDGSDDPALLMGRGHALAGLGDYEAAERDLLRAGTSSAAGPEVFYDRALLRLREADLAGYREVCRLAVERFGGTTVATAANTVAWTCSLAPDSGVDPATVLALAERAVASRPGESAFQNTRAAALYRCGRFAEARDRLLAAVRRSSDGGTVEDWLLLAMTHGRTGQPEQARMWLSRARAKLAASPPVGPDSPPADWDRAMDCERLRREAEGVVADRDR